MSMTRGKWAEQFLRALGNNNPSASTVNFVACWTLAENTRAAFNPLATTQPMAGSTNFNTVGVKNYRDNATGIEATVKTLTNGRYPHILAGLRTNNPEQAANSAELGVWGTGLHGVALWRLGDHRNGTLLSHPASATKEPQSAPIPTNERPVAEPKQTGANTAMAASDTEQLQKDLQYIVMGGLMLAVALFIAVKTYVPVQQVVKTIAAAA